MGSGMHERRRTPSFVAPALRFRSCVPVALPALDLICSPISYISSRHLLHIHKTTTMRTMTSIVPLTVAAWAILTTSSPIYPGQQSNANLTNFLLVTTTQCSATNLSATLANVSAVSLFDPYDQSAFLLRLIEPGYNSIPTFNLTNGDLHTISSGIEGFGTYVYNSTGMATAGEELGLRAAPEPMGNLGLKNGYLLVVDGEEWGWTVCDGELEESVVSFCLLNELGGREANAVPDLLERHECQLQAHLHSRCQGCTVLERWHMLWWRRRR